MSNRAWNNLIVFGSKEDLQRFKENVGSAVSPFDLDKIIPVSGDPNNTDDRRAVHGCNWIINETLKKESDTSLQYCFSSCWCSPYKVMNKLFSDYPELMFDYDCGDGMAGWEEEIKVRNGEIVFWFLYQEDSNGKKIVKDKLWHHE